MDVENYAQLEAALRNKIAQRTRGGADQLRKMAQLFAGHRGITARTMRKTLQKQFNLPLTDVQARSLFARFDHAGTGTIELRAFMQQLMDSDVVHEKGKQLGDDGISRAATLRQRELVARKRGPPVSTASVAQLITQLTDKMMQRSRGGSDQFRKVFKLFAKARGISQREFIATIAQHFGIMLAPAQAALLFARFDSNGNGTIDLRELMEALMPKDWQREEWYVKSSQRAELDARRLKAERCADLNFGESPPTGFEGLQGLRGGRGARAGCAGSGVEPRAAGYMTGPPRDRRSSVVGSLMRMDGFANASAGSSVTVTKSRLQGMPPLRPRKIGANAVLGMMPPGAKDERCSAQRSGPLVRM